MRADVRELSRALTNLVVNALRHTPPDGVVTFAAVVFGHEKVPAAAHTMQP
jgi:signal transduction histidine kinase